MADRLRTPIGGALRLLLAVCLLLPAACGAARPGDCGLGGTTAVPGVAGALAFACDLEPSGGFANRDLFVADLAGGRTRRLTHDLAQDLEPAWSPDGSEIAFSSTRGGRLSLYAMRADGSGVRPLAGSLAQDFEADWSPDGRLVVFASSREGARGPLGPKGQPARLFAVRPDGTGLARLTDTSGYDGDPAFSPDGARLAFVSDRAGTADVWTMSEDGGRPVRVTRSGGMDDRPTWSPDGARLAFGRVAAGKHESVLCVAEADGSGLHRLLRGDAREPAWSPDGSWIAFVSDRDGHPNLYLASADGSRILQLTRDWAPKFRPAWRRS